MNSNPTRLPPSPVPLGRFGTVNMNKSFSVVVALVCGTLATVVASRWLTAKEDGTGVAMTDIFVAVAAINVGDEISPEKIKLEQWPSDRIPVGSTGDLTLIEGRFAKQQFYEGEAIMPVKLMDDNWNEVPKSYRVVAMNASDSGISNLIQPGDRVDVTAFFQKNELIPQSMTRTVLRGVRVYALDGDTQRRTNSERIKNLRNIQLLIHEDETSAWELAQRLGEVSLLVSSDADNAEGRNEAGEEFTTWLSELQNRREVESQAKTTFENFRRNPAPEPVALPAAPAVVEAKPEGYKMIKHSGGSMIEYWIVPGELPRKIGEVGDSEGIETNSFVPESSSASSAESSSHNQYSYLNGQNSPFFNAEKE